MGTSGLRRGELLGRWWTRSVSPRRQSIPGLGDWPVDSGIWKSRLWVWCSSLLCVKRTTEEASDRWLPLQTPVSGRPTASLSWQGAGRPAGLSKRGSGADLTRGGHISPSLTTPSFPVRPRAALQASDIFSATFQRFSSFVVRQPKCRF